MRGSYELLQGGFNGDGDHSDARSCSDNTGVALLRFLIVGGLGLGMVAGKARASSSVATVLFVGVSGDDESGCLIGLVNCRSWGL